MPQNPSREKGIKGWVRSLSSFLSIAVVDGDFVAYPPPGCRAVPTVGLKIDGYDGDHLN